MSTPTELKQWLEIAARIRDMQSRPRQLDEVARWMERKTPNAVRLPAAPIPPCEVCGYDDCDWVLPSPCSCEPGDCPEEGHGG